MWTLASGCVSTRFESQCAAHLAWLATTIHPLFSPSLWASDRSTLLEASPYGVQPSISTQRDLLVGALLTLASGTF